MIKFTHASVFILILFIFNKANGQSGHQKGVNHNPIIADMLADPSIVNFDGIYYCYATTDGYGQGLKTSGPPVVWTSKDFLHWSYKGILFPSIVGQLYWAPSKVVYANGKYYLYPTLNGSIYVAISSSPMGPFKLANGADTLFGPTAPKPIVNYQGPKGTKGIDAEVFVDDDGQGYLFWAKHGAAKLNANMVNLEDSVINIQTKRGGYSEGPIVFKRKGIYYYLYTLSGNENYQYAYGYSKVSPFGPYIFPQNDIITTTDHKKGIYGPGHGNVFCEPGTDNYYICYLEFGNGSTNRRIYADRLNFNKDGTLQPVVLTHQGIGPFSKKKGKINLALDGKASASSVMDDFKVQPIKDPSLNRSETYIPKNAIDGNYGTRWMALSSDENPWFELDLGEVRNISRTEIYFNKPTELHNYALYSSQDRINWHLIATHLDFKLESPRIDREKQKARYLRIKILKGTPGIWAFEVY